MMMSHREPPDPARVITWVIVTWVGSAISCALAIWKGDWPYVAVSVNACVVAAGWALASARWAEWQALALSAFKELDVIRKRENNGTA